MTKDPETMVAHAPGSALEAAIRAGFLAKQEIEGQDGAKHVFVPKDFTLVKLSDDTQLPPWPRQKITVDDRASLSAYANRHSRPGISILIADYDALKITAHLDWHPANDHDLAGKAAPDQHAVTLALRLSEEFARWDGFEGKLHSQEDFARFIEENSVDIAFPEAAIMLEISRDLEAAVGQTFKGRVNLSNGDRAMKFESETKVQNEIAIPEKFVLSIPIYNGEHQMDLTCLFRWRANGQGGLLMGFQWHRVEYQRRAHFAEIAARAAEETGLPIFAGRKGG